MVKIKEAIKEIVNKQTELIKLTNNKLKKIRFGGENF